MGLASDLKQLRQIECKDKCVLSVYLNTGPNQQGDWSIHLKNGLKRIGEYLEASGDETQLKNFKKVRKQVDQELGKHRNDLARSLIIFASEENDLFETYYLQHDVETSFHWETKPVLEPLEALQQKFPSTGIILTNLDHVTVLDTSLGHIDATFEFAFDPETEEWVRFEGTASDDRMASSSSQVDKFDRRLAENLGRFYRDLAQTVEQMKGAHDWESLVVIGEAELSNSFRDELRTKPERVVHKNLSKSSAPHIIEAAFH
ncbi:VLRF1 family aeRF1-type release factor [Exiguobacterium sp. s142]|uniref:VLRF1 family aeRF1-type release factor n=1 Tax=Exiguobacterium sp. s142 TaxID=2751222 RepID=UPI001BE74947|nr:VLRF1 family aeRF1-type release factor [Exiguobacterium sp. s142]